MAYKNASGNREQDDEQDRILRELGGDGGATFSTQPVGEPVAMEEAATAPAATGRDARKALGGYNSNGTMLGFNTAMNYGDDKAANSMKNTFGRIASRYVNKPSSVDSIMADADFQRFFPGATKVAGGQGDKINFNGMLSDFESGTPVYEVDVLGAADAANDTAQGWAWQDQVNDMGGGGGGTSGGGYDVISQLLSGNQSAVDELGNSDALDQILKALAEQGGPQV